MMGEETKATEAKDESKPEPAKDDAITARLTRLEAANAALKAEKDKLIEQVKEHGAEMKAKKERERKALEEAGQYKEALELLAKEQQDHKAMIDEFQTQRQQWEIQRKRYAIMAELQKPGVINASVPAADVLQFIDFKKVELDESGAVADWHDHYTGLITGRDYLKPTGVGKSATGIAPPPAGTNGSVAAS
jgi:hypothetical protein